jgi:hypothetical protein
MDYTVAVFFTDTQSVYKAFLPQGPLNGWPILRYRNGDIKGINCSNGEHPAVVFAIDSPTEHLAPEARHLVQEMFIVRKNYKAAHDILEQKGGRNELRKQAVRFVVRLDTRSKPPGVVYINPRRNAA